VETVTSIKENEADVVLTEGKVRKKKRHQEDSISGTRNIGVALMVHVVLNALYFFHLHSLPSISSTFLDMSAFASSFQSSCLLPVQSFLLWTVPQSRVRHVSWQSKSSSTACRSIGGRLTRPVVTHHACQIFSRYLYDILSNKHAQEERLPVLIACNKSDLLTAFKKDRIQSLLEAEM